MSEHPKAVRALMLANASVLVLNLENLHALRDGLLAMQMDFKKLLREQEATEARHAAELRELKERFSEVAAKVDALLSQRGYRRDGTIRQALAPFILPAPDPVSEWLAECSDSRVSDHTMTMLRLFYNWLSEKETRKIGEAGE